uniref:Charged multivesicular body protein 6 n=1 Tax=Hemiselmis andersenii TaxID=464988 RepID=A0A7S1E2X7_HEMAN|mmetsp:Transcript_33730/g.82234  ORF Transcript_33730/g.82234 Transcript_33730/m.82234 type:complete len:190 (+) Transcript_33730:393-962(+)
MHRVAKLTAEAKQRRAAGDMHGTKKRLLDRKRLQLQLDKLRGSINMVDMHIATIEGTELNKSILQTLKESAQALQRLGVDCGVWHAEDVMAEVESELESANEIGKALAGEGLVGQLNSMGGDLLTEEDLEAELQELGEDSDNVYADSARVENESDLQFPKVPSSMNTQVAKAMTEEQSDIVEGGSMFAL